MTIEQSKEKLKKEGYTFFELNDFDPEFYNWLLPAKFHKNSSTKEVFTFLRADSINLPENQKIQINEDFLSFKTAEEKKNEIFSKLNLLNGNAKKFINQIWYFTDLDKFLNKSKLNIDDYKIHVKKIIKYFFDLEESQNYSFLSTATLYDEKCFLENHSDGIQKNRICAILIYINENYNENDGGCLVLNDNEVVVPTFGKVAIIDLQSFDINHMVTEVTGGEGRCTLLSFINKI